MPSAVSPQFRKSSNAGIRLGFSLAQVDLETNTTAMPLAL
jgi:hypothetical protein